MPDGREQEKLTRGNVHLASYAAILTGSISSDWWAKEGAQPLYFRHPEEWDTNTHPDSFQPTYLDTKLTTFDYVWGCQLDALHRGYLRQRAVRVATGGNCELWKLGQRVSGD